MKYCFYKFSTQYHHNRNKWQLQISKDRATNHFPNANIIKLISETAVCVCVYSIFQPLAIVCHFPQAQTASQYIHFPFHTMWPYIYIELDTKASLLLYVSWIWPCRAVLLRDHAINLVLSHECAILVQNNYCLFINI